MKKRWLSLAAAVAALGLLASCGSAPPVTLHSGITPRKTVVSSPALREPAGVPGMEPVAQAGHCAMYADMSTGLFAIEDLRTGKVFHSALAPGTEDAYAQDVYRNWLYSQVIITTVDPESGSVSSDNSYIAVVKKDAQSVERLDDGIRVTYRFLKKAITLAVEYRLLEDGFYAAVDTDRIAEEGTEYLYNIKLLPMFGAAAGSEDGFLLIPDGSGAQILFGDKRAWGAQPYRAHVYGNDAMLVAEQKSSDAETVTLPAVGLSDGTGGFLAVADCGEAYAYVDASAARQMTGYHMGFFDFDVRLSENAVIGDIRSWNYRKVVSYDKGAISLGTLAVRYFLLDGTENDLVGMAGVLRGCLLAQRTAPVHTADAAPLVLRVLCGTKKRTSVLGIPVERDLAVTTADGASRMVERLRQDGVSAVRLCLDGWSDEQLGGRLTTRTDIASFLGPEKDWDALAEKLRQDGGGLYLDTVLSRYTKSGAGYSRDRSAIRDINGAVVALPRYRRDVYYPDASGTTDRLLQAGLSARALQDLAAAAEKSGRGLVLSDIGTLLGSDYGSGGLRRGAAADCLAAAVSAAAGQTELYGEGVNWYVLREMDALLSAADTASLYPAVSRAVPFLQLVLRGVMDVVSRPINTAGNTEHAFLFCLATGQIPAYQVAADMPASWRDTDADDCYAADLSAWYPDIVRQYRAFSAVFAATKGAAVTDLQMQDGGVIVTVYDNGVRTVVNTGARPVTVDGIDVPASDYILLRRAAE